MSLLEHVMGLDNPSGPWYLFHSGFAGYFSYLGSLGIIATLLRRHNCEVHGCHRLARHATAAGHTVCRRHSPEGAPTAQEVHRAHHAAKARTEQKPDPRRGGW